ncbi:MAG: hypothetical protein ACXW4H_07130 [Candidatus Limnocylindrales bacterium]
MSSDARRDDRLASVAGIAPPVQTLRPGEPPVVGEGLIDPAPGAWPPPR